jgi:hypothetical protein
VQGGQILVGGRRFQFEGTDQFRAAVEGDGDRGPEAGRLAAEVRPRWREGRPVPPPPLVGGLARLPKAGGRLAALVDHARRRPGAGPVDQVVPLNQGEGRPGGAAQPPRMFGDEFTQGRNVPLGRHDFLEGGQQGGKPLFLPPGRPNGPEPVRGGPPRERRVAGGLEFLAKSASALVVVAHDNPSGSRVVDGRVGRFGKAPSEPV